MVTLVLARTGERVLLRFLSSAAGDRLHSLEEESECLELRRRGPTGARSKPTSICVKALGIRMARPTDVDDSAFNFICEDGVIGTDPPRASNSGIASEKSSAEVSPSSGIAPEKSFAEASSCAAVHVRKRFGLWPRVLAARSAFLPVPHSGTLITRLRGGASHVLAVDEC